MSDPSKITLENLPDKMAELADFAKRDETMRKLIQQLGQTLADLMEHQESSAPELAKAIAEGLKGIKVESPKMEIKPQVDVHLTVTPTIEQRERTGWKFHVEPGAYGAMDITCTPL